MKLWHNANVANKIVQSAMVDGQDDTVCNNMIGNNKSKTMLHVQEGEQNERTRYIFIQEVSTPLISQQQDVAM